MAGIGNPVEESANFYRLVSLVVDRGSDVLRDVLLHLVKPSTLEAVLQAKINVINNLQQKKVIFAEQYALLTKVPPNAEEFDISLLVKIFQNICPNIPAPILGWGTKKPDANDFSLAADILRLRNIRNEVYAHRSSTKVTNADFEPLWFDLSQVIERISKHGSGKHQGIRQTILMLKQQNLDPEDDRERNMLEIFQNWQKQDEDFKTLLMQRFDKQDTGQKQSNQLLQEIHRHILKIPHGITLNTLTFTPCISYGLEKADNYCNRCKQHMCLDCKGKHGNGTNTENRLDSDLGASQQTNQIKTIRVPIKEAISPVFMKDHSSSVSPRGNQLSDEMADIASRVEVYRDEIKQCILDDMVLLGMRGIIPKDTEIRLRQMYTTDRAGATEQMLDIISQSNEPGKWQQFVDALKEEDEYPYLAFLLTTRTMPSRNYDHERNIIRIFLPRLARRINPMTYVPHLYSANCITMGDMQVIISQDKNVGTQAGAIMLLERIQCRQAPVVWYKKLLELMMADEQGDLVKEMEPDFYANSEQTGYGATNTSCLAQSEQYTPSKHYHRKT